LTVKPEAGTTPPKKNEEEPFMEPTLTVLSVLLLASIPPPTPRDPAQPLVGAKDKDVSRLRNQVRRLRFEHGEMTQQQLAEKACVTRQTIIAIEADRYSPSLGLAFRIARIFGVSVEEVFQYQEGEPKG
jgi:putative transcriptional regulator